MTDKKETQTNGRRDLPDGYRQGVITAITVFIGFSLVFMRFWNFEAEGHWTITAMAAAAVLTLATALQCWALWRALQVVEDALADYEVTLRWFGAGMVVLIVGVLLAAWAASSTQAR